MLAKLTKKNNCSIQKAISEAISEGLRHEVQNLVRLEGERLESFVQIFGLGFVTPPEIYYNKFNVLFCEEYIHSQVSSLISKKNLVLRIEIPKTNINIWCYEMFNDALLFNIFDDIEKDPTSLD